MGQEERAPSTLETRCSSRGSTRTTKNQSSKNKEQRRSDRLLLWNWLQEIRVWHVEYLAPTLTTVTRGDTLVYSRELRLNYIQNEYHILPKKSLFFDISWNWIFTCVNSFRFSQNDHLKCETTKVWKIGLKKQNSRLYKADHSSWITSVIATQNLTSLKNLPRITVLPVPVPTSLHSFFVRKS